MAGAMAGSAILAAEARRTTLGTVTLTMNNDCNLACPHCYLQYEGRKGLLSQSTLDSVLASGCERVCIVGKEPLANRQSIAMVGEIARGAVSRGKVVSMITNGLNARLLPAEIVRAFAWIDVSLDGGPHTYEAYRQGSWSKLRAAISALHEAGLAELRLLQTVSRQTIGTIDDMLEAQSLLGGSMTIFSPYQTTRSSGVQGAAAIEPTEFLNALAPFAQLPDVIVALDSLYTRQFPDIEGIIQRGEELFGDRFIFVDDDPIDRGLIRVTYDGLVLSPFEAVNTRDYAVRGRILDGTPLDGIFEEMLNSARSSCVH
ncbi:MAG: hypothetical protein JWR84_1726 [Caulobacter sp.]|nr:hypothetical protein [Caulobacter sp.]